MLGLMMNLQKVYKTVVESQLAGFFIDGFYHGFLHMKVMRKIQKHFRLQHNLSWQNKIYKRFQLWSNNHDGPKGRTEEPMEIDHITPQKKMFFMSQWGHLAKHCRSKSVNAIVQVGEPKTGDIHCWRS